MEQKVLICWEIEEGEHVFRFHVPAGAPLGSIYNAAFKVLDRVTELSKEATEKANPEQKEEDGGKVAD